MTETSKPAEDNTWHPYDLTRKNSAVGPGHQAEYIVDDWEEIRPVIQGIYDKNHAIEKK